MGKKKKRYNVPKDPIKAMKKASRDLEMEMGVRFTYNHTHESKKRYNRKNKDWKKDIQSFNFPIKTLYNKNVVFFIKKKIRSECTYVEKRVYILLSLRFLI